MTTLPYDVLTKIFGYLDDISDSGWTFALSGSRFRLKAKSSFTSIDDVLHFKAIHPAKSVFLKIREYTPTFDNVYEYVVETVETQYKMPEIQDVYFHSRYVCCSFVHPIKHTQRIAYIESRVMHNLNNSCFLYGSVFNSDGKECMHIVSGFGPDEETNIINIEFTPYIFEAKLEYNGDYILADELMNGPGEEDELVDEEDGPEPAEPYELQMYM